MEENKGLLAVTLTVVLVTIIAMVGLLVIFAPEPVSDEVVAENLYTEDSYTKGSDDPIVRVVVFEDFQCPACAQSNNTINEIVKNYGDSVQFTHKHFPLSFHQNAVEASLAAEAAGAQGLFYEYGDILYSRQSEWDNLSGEVFTEKLVEYAEEVGVEDMDLFQKDLEERTYIDKINRDQEAGIAINVNATPTVYLNEEVVTNPSYVNLERLILDAIEDAGN